ncbi:MAG: hypothetical protein K2X35_19715 [Bryobacteraceae bacterium]|nr:hypothetical protein [Bryobacteraceae bacterium]
MTTLINPMNEASREAGQPAPRLATLSGKRIALLDISKPGGSVFLDRVEALLRRTYGVADVLRERKPTFTKPAPEAVIGKITQWKPDAVVEGLAD